MSYRNINDQRKYQREWYRRKHAGLSTRNLGFKKREKQSEQEKREKRILIQRENKARRTKLIDETYGSKCMVCLREAKKSGRAIHRKDGQPHKQFTSLGLKEIKETINKDREKYIRLCSGCHRAIHWCMKYLGMNWDEIEKRLRLAE